MQTHRDYQIEDQLFCQNRARNISNDPIGPKNRISFRLSFRIDLTWLAATSRLPFKCFRNFIENPEGAKLLLLILHTYYISTDHLTLAIPFLSHGCVFQIPKARFSSRSSSGVWLNMFYYQYRIHSNNSARHMSN